MSLAKAISRWTSHTPQEPESEAWMCGPPKPIERRKKHTLRRLHHLLEAEAPQADNDDAAIAETPPDEAVRTAAGDAAA